MKVSLVGYMASGKSTIGRFLAERRGVQFVDLDQLIAEKVKMEVDEFIRTKGELAFRKEERVALLEVLDSNVEVLSCGGGTPCYYDNMDELLHSSFVVYLQANIPTLVNRIQEARESRPLIDGVNNSDLKEFVAKHVFDRRPFYERAHHIVFTDGKSPEQISIEIIEAWQKYKA